MKMKRIANDVALQTLGYLIGMNQEVEVYYRIYNGNHTGVHRKELIFKGTFENFRRKHISCVDDGEWLSHNQVEKVCAVDGVLQIEISE